jgi:hypothetical protein
MKMGAKERFTQEIYEQCVAVDKKRIIVITKEEYDLHITILMKYKVSKCVLECAQACKG